MPMTEVLHDIQIKVKNFYWQWETGAGIRKAKEEGNLFPIGIYLRNNSRVALDNGSFENNFASFTL